jgi:hypothetical protein
MIVPSLKGFLFTKANQMNKEAGDLIWENNVFVWPRTNPNISKERMASKVFPVDRSLSDGLST